MFVGPILMLAFALVWRGWQIQTVRVHRRSHNRDVHTTFTFPRTTYGRKVIQNRGDKEDEVCVMCTMQD